MPHAIDSPSSLRRRKLCPGSRRMEKEHGIDYASAAAIDGTHTHWLVQYCLEEGITPANMVGGTMEDDEGQFEVDEERADRASVMVEYVNNRAMELGAEIHTEVAVDPGTLVGRDDMKGTSDVVLVGDDMIEVIDYKDGFLHVSIEDNDQLISYLTGAVADLWPSHKQVGGMTITIVQPRNVDQGLDPVSSTGVPFETWEQWRVETRDRLAEADLPDADLIPGEEQCRFCDAGAVCSKRAEAALSGVTFPVVVPETSSLDEKAEALQGLAEFDPATLTEEQLVLFLQGIPLAKQTFKAVEEYAKQQALAGNRLGGQFYPKKTFGNRTWSESEKTVASRLQSRGLKVADIYEKKLRSPTQILKNKALTAKHKEYIQDKLIRRKETGVKLVHVSEGGESALPHAPDGMFQPAKSPEGDRATPSFLTPPTGQE